jgi:hypothetical protein
MAESLISRFLDTNEAEGEARGYLEADLDGDELVAAVARAVRRTAGYVPTARLAERCGTCAACRFAHAVDLAVIAYADDVLDLSGVWWEDRYDTAGYSVPRSVLFARHLSTRSSARLAAEEDTAPLPAIARWSATARPPWPQSQTPRDARRQPGEHNGHTRRGSQRPGSADVDAAGPV